MRLVFSRQAEADLEEIADYIARDNPRRALSFVQELRAQCGRVAEAPLAFRERPELRAGLRSCPFRRYVIFYVIEPQQRVMIVRVLHSARDLMQLFEDD